ncbi:RDD family protein [Leucobacter coleopterorum]|uniref:RDD family protein n=1 Tax=Leucobacter coleopterorum TaxID=2714933 RepID=A0ABX6JZT4_9MICO|nr:RDD family protein [Leucobacter coleopterorum]
MTVSAPPSAPPQMYPAAGSPLAPQAPGVPGSPVHQGNSVNIRGVSNARASARLAAALARSRAWARPAGTGARLAAFTVDAVCVLGVAAAVALLFRSLVLGVLVLLELGVILTILESRTGITLGNLMLRLRTVRDDAPYSPGVGRGAVRSLVLGAASAVAYIGGWIVVATSAADPMQMGRSLADRAGRTLVVKVPTAAERAEWARGAERWAVNSRQVTSQPVSSRQQRAVRAQAPQAQPPQPVQTPIASMPPGFVAPQAPLAQQAPRVQSLVPGQPARRCPRVTHYPKVSHVRRRSRASISRSGHRNCVGAPSGVPRQRTLLSCGPIHQAGGQIPALPRHAVRTAEICPPGLCRSTHPLRRRLPCETLRLENSCFSRSTPVSVHSCRSRSP